MNKELILEPHVHCLKLRNHVAHIQDVLSHPATKRVLFRHKPLNDGVCVRLSRANKLILHLLKVLLSNLTVQNSSPYCLIDGVLNDHETLTVERIPFHMINVVCHLYGSEVPFTSGKGLGGIAIMNHRLLELLGSVRRQRKINLH
jgi:hypothetical protein